MKPRDHYSDPRPRLPFDGLRVPIDNAEAALLKFATVAVVVMVILLEVMR